MSFMRKKMRNWCSLGIRLINTHLKIISSFFFTPTQSAWPLHGNTALKSIFWETLFLDHLHDFYLLSLNSFLHPILHSKFLKKFLDTKKFLLTIFKNSTKSLTQLFRNLIKWQYLTPTAWELKEHNISYNKISTHPSKTETIRWRNFSWKTCIIWLFFRIFDLGSSFLTSGWFSKKKGY